MTRYRNQLAAAVAAVLIMATSFASLITVPPAPEAAMARLA